MSSVPTTDYGTWANITAHSLTPEQYVADGLGEYAADYDIAAAVGEFLTELQAKLPAGLTILGNGELIGPAYGPEADAIGALVGEDRSVTDYVKELIVGEDGVGGIDLQAIMDRHDLTERAKRAAVHLVNDDGTRGEVIDLETIHSPDEAHNLLASIEDDPDAADFGAEPGTVVDLVITAGQDEDYVELRAARVTLR